MFFRKEMLERLTRAELIIDDLLDRVEDLETKPKKKVARKVKAQGK